MLANIMPEPDVPAQDAFSNASPIALELYKELINNLKMLIGPFEIEVKKSSVHLVRGSAFADVHPRKKYLGLTIASKALIESPRIVKVEKVSENLWHLELKLLVEGDIDKELTGWLGDAYALCG